VLAKGRLSRNIQQLLERLKFMHARGLVLRTQKFGSMEIKPAHDRGRVAFNFFRTDTTRRNVSKNHQTLITRDALFKSTVEAAEEAFR